MKVIVIEIGRCESDLLANESAVLEVGAVLKLEHAQSQSASANLDRLLPSEVDVCQASKHELRHCALFHESKTEESNLHHSRHPFSPVWYAFGSTAFPRS
jgi:hypothetical protein